jgi:periplasmic divalent cation tolerance protein
MTEAILVLTTVPSAEAGERIARALVEARLAACVNVLPPMVSVYRWKGEVQRETEQQLVIKTARARLAALEEQLAQLHPYDLPELLVLNVEDGDPAYLSWVLTEADPEGG